jgi:hypothetical protein
MLNIDSTLFNMTFSAEAIAGMLQERFVLVKCERDTWENESKTRLTNLVQKLKELQLQYKVCLEQLNSQSKQCDHLNGENKQLLEYVVSH